jgi:hypothetical protein
MTSDLGVWTADDCALVLIDYQQEMFEVITGIERLAHAGAVPTPRSRSQPSCSATGRARSPAPRSTSSTGTSGKSRS